MRKTNQEKRLKRAKERRVRNKARVIGMAPGNTPIMHPIGGSEYSMKDYFGWLFFLAIWGAGVVLGLLIGWLKLG